MKPDTTHSTQQYPFDCQRMQTIVRELMLGDPWFSDRWEPAHGGMITAQISPNAYPVEVSWQNALGGTALTAALLAPQHVRGGFLGLGRRSMQNQQAALQSFFARVDRAVAQRIDSDRIASAL
jgi:hypothetical protein